MNPIGWMCVSTSRETHVVPLADSSPHKYGSTCWCQPLEDEPDLWVHNSADGREAYETGRRQLN